MRWLAASVAVSLASGAGAAPIDVAAEIDAYWQAPRSAATYRALAGLGDPTFGWREQPFDQATWDDERVLINDRWGGGCRTAYAIQTWRRRTAELGANHPYVRHWLSVQRAVFSACAGWDEKNRVLDPLPAPLALGDARLARMQAADRAYQAAARLFYENKVEPARAAFAAIAAAPGPHQAAARLMVASIAAGSTRDTYGTAKAAGLGQAEALLKDPKAATMRLEAQQLVGWIGATTDTPATRAAQVRVTVEALHLPIELLRTDEEAKARFEQALRDLPKLWTDFDNKDWWITGAIPPDYHGSRAVAATAMKDRMIAFTLVQPPCRQKGCVVDPTIGYWASELPVQSDRDAWRVARLGGSGEGEASWAELDALVARVQAAPSDRDVALLTALAEDKLRGAFEVRKWDGAEAAADRRAAVAFLARWPWPKSQFFITTYVEGLQSLAALGRPDEARRLRDLVEPRLEPGDGWPSRGELLLLLAEDGPAMRAAMVRNGVGASTLLDRLPRGGLEALARDQAVPAADRARLARVAWVRAYVSEKKMPRLLDELMRGLNPELVAGWTSRPGAKTDDDRLLLDVLRSPGLNLRVEARQSKAEGEPKPGELDLYQHSMANWWCAGRPAEQAEREERALAGATGEADRPGLEALLAESWLWKQLDPAERAEVAEAPMAPRLLAEKAVRWAARANPKKPKGADEALALAVRATRYGCQMQGGHGPWSKAAWDLLHQRFPGTPAAVRTRWWFDCKHFTYGCTESGSDDYGREPEEEPAGE